MSLAMLDIELFDVASVLVSWFASAELFAFFVMILYR